MEKKELIGRKVVGFIFDPTEYPTVAYSYDMLLASVDLVGEIISYHTNNDTFYVHFPNVNVICGVYYPAVLIKEHLLEEPKSDDTTIEEKHKYLVEKGYGLKDYLSDLDNLIETGWFKVGNIKECVSYHKDYDMHDFIQKGREYLRQMLVGNEHELPNKSSNIDYGKIEHDPLDSLPLIGDGVLMEVSNDGHGWSKRYVFGKRGNIFFTWDTENYDEMYSWAFARPTKKTKITRKEFESKFEIID